jgi:hypothetical protein
MIGRKPKIGYAPEVYSQVDKLRDGKREMVLSQINHLHRAVAADPTPDPQGRLRVEVPEPPPPPLRIVYQYNERSIFSSGKLLVIKLEP